MRAAMTANNDMDSLAEDETAVLHEALDDEYRAWATYNQVIADFGEVRPFINIREAEARHIEALVRLFERYGISVPENPWPGKVESYPDLETACRAGVEAEIANAGMYDRLLEQTQREDIRMVLRNLQEASQERHLPAFRRCLENRGQGGGGMGRQQRRRGRH